jgi:two-component system nitrogen regulation response regulator NtrX
MKHEILIVDDEEMIRGSLRGILEDEAYGVLEAASGEEALAMLSRREVSAILLDIWMDGIDGLETLRRIKGYGEGALAGDGERNPVRLLNREAPVIMMSGHGTIHTAVAATKSGAYDFLEKPLSLERVLLLLERAIRELILVRENRALKARVDEAHTMIGATPVMRQLEEQIRRVAPTESWVLITGENGTGKEVAARRIHRLSARVNGPFVAVDSASAPERLMENELFGQEAGAFGPTSEARIGHVEQGHQGTLFLDEIGDMELTTQARLLRMLQEQRLERMGGQRSIPVDVRVIAASNKNLTELMARGQFREDLYYRLNVIPLRVPPLRDRLEDIPLLVDYFMARHAQQERSQHRFSEAALTAMKGYHWPGNVRELKNVVDRSLIMAVGPLIQVTDLPEAITGMRAVPRESLALDALESDDLRTAREIFERAYLQRQLEKHQGNISRTAETVGMERSALHRKLKTLGLA